MPSAQPTLWNENFVSTSKNLLKNRNWTFPALRCFTWKIEFVSNILWMMEDQKLCQFLFFHCYVIFDFLRLGQISCVIPLIQMESTLFKTLKLQNFGKICGWRCATGAPLLHHIPKFFKAVSKQYIATKQQKKVRNLEPCIFFKVKKLIFCHFSKIWKFKIPCDVIKSKLGQKWVKFLHYIPTVIKRSTSIILVFSRL